MKIILLLICLFLFGTNIHSQNCIPNTNSLEFDSTTAYVSFAPNSSLNISGAITVEAWINANAWRPTSAKGSIVCKHGWTFGEQGYVLRAGGAGQLSFNIAGQDSLITWREVLSISSALQLNTWHHVAGTFDGTMMYIYIDGNVAGSLAFAGAIFPSIDYPLKIGKLADDGQLDKRFWSGKIDEVRIWSRALSQSEISSNMFHHINPIAATSLVGYWRLNDGVSTSVSDLGMAGATGTLTGNAAWSTIVPFTEGPMAPLVSQIGSVLYSSSSAGNQWYLNGTLIPGATDTSYTPSQNGAYTVTVTDINNCTATSPPHTVTSLSLDDQAGKQFIIGENAFERTINFYAPSELLNQAELTLLDINGRSVAYLEKGRMSNIMDISFLPSGIYILHIVMDSGALKKKIIIN